jgi:multicomponent Na+:H+ antiporter subunit E
MKHMKSTATDHKSSLDWRIGLDAVLRFGSFAAFWWLLNEGDNAAWTLGIPTVAAATLISLAFVPPRPWRIRPYGALRFGLYFVRKSLLSSVDVAQRVFKPRIPIKPRLVRYPLRLKEVNAQVIMANTASLLPGTLSVGLAENVLTLHVLDIDAPIREELNVLEKRVAALFGLPLQERSE